MLFLPFEQRMTRDIQQRRERRAVRRTAKSTDAKSLAATESDVSKASLLEDLPSGPSDAVVRTCPSCACKSSTAGACARSCASELLRPL